jgi:hypothetical protein
MPLSFFSCGQPFDSNRKSQLRQETVETEVLTEIENLFKAVKKESLFRQHLA